MKFHYPLHNRSWQLAKDYSLAFHELFFDTLKSLDDRLNTSATLIGYFQSKFCSSLFNCLTLQIYQNVLIAINCARLFTDLFSFDLVAILDN